MTDPLTILCPGQGAQAVGMGRAWAESSDAARRVFERADAAFSEAGIGAASGLKLSELCFDGPSERLNMTDASQPAIFVAGVASWHGLCESLGVEPSSMPLAAAGGLSLGEYTALHLAGAFGFEDGLRLVTLRGRAMQDAAEATPSSMVAVIGADEESAANLCETARARASEATGNDEVLVAANFNAPGQVVVSGSVAACDEAEKAAGEMSLRATRLAVAGAFHSPLMAPAAERLRAALASVEVRTPRCPVLANVTGKPHGEPDQIRSRLVEQLTGAVRWEACCRWIIEHAPEAAPHELAPGKSLAGLMRRVDKSFKVTTHDQPA